MELSTVFGFVVGLAAVVGGQVLEGGHLGQIMQFTAALIVVGGTLGATLVSFPIQDVKAAIKFLPKVFMTVNTDPRDLIDEIIKVATIARKDGVLAVEGMRGQIQDELFKNSLRHVVDGFEPATVIAILEAEIDHAMSEETEAGKVLEGAGGYSPTIGIIGAVLGLIHVMTLLDDPSKIGGGIAVAFVATVYGVGLANLWLIPMGTKLKRKAKLRAIRKEVVMVGIVGIQEGLNPHFLKEKLEVYVDEHLRRHDEGNKK